MTRETIALPVADAAKFAKALRAQLQTRFDEKQSLPGHVELLNMLSRAAGFRNFQTLKSRPAITTNADTDATSKDAKPNHSSVPSSSSSTLTDTARKAMGQFDAQGRLVRLPVKFTVQRMVMWALWLHLPAKRVMREREVNEVLKAWNTFGDHVSPRREMIEMGLMSRKPDGSEYRKEPQRPSAEVAAFLKAYRGLLPKARSSRG